MGVAIFYILANIALAIHLFHGSWSLFQSLGFNNPRFNNARRYFATGFAVLIGGHQHQLPHHDPGRRRRKLRSEP